MVEMITTRERPGETRNMPHPIISSYRSKILKLARFNARKSIVVQKNESSIETPRVMLDLTEPLKDSLKRDLALGQGKRNEGLRYHRYQGSINNSREHQGETKYDSNGRLKQETLFIKIPLPDAEPQKTSLIQTNTAPTTAGTKQRSHKPHVSSKLVFTNATRNSSRIDTSLNASSTISHNLYSQVAHQLSRKGDVKITQDPTKGVSVAETVEIKYPINPGKALKLFMDRLTDFEKGEILDYKKIYFLGINSEKIKASALSSQNYGFDDERGDYKVTIKDHLAYRYEVLDALGSGSFGQTLKCFDYKKNEQVALKIIRNKKRFHHQAVIEAKILKYIRDNDIDDCSNLVRMKEFFIFRNHFCITFEVLSIIVSKEFSLFLSNHRQCFYTRNNEFQGISMGLIRRFAIQILQALKFLKDSGIIHCDMKPENILLKQPNKSGIKVIDVGSGCFENEKVYTYIQSRFYRAPEIMLGIPYSPAIDMWSFGCIMAELFMGYPIFPGECEKEQLAMIMELRGLPPKQIIDISCRKKLFFDSRLNPILEPNSRGKMFYPGARTLLQKIRCTDANFMDFVSRCLEWDPDKRMTPEEALQHPWVLEGLPPKILAHHRRACGLQEPSVPEKPLLAGLKERVSQRRISIQIGTRAHVKEASKASLNTSENNENARPPEKTSRPVPPSGQKAFFIRLGRRINPPAKLNITNPDNSSELNTTNEAKPKVKLNKNIVRIRKNSIVQPSAPAGVFPPLGVDLRPALPLRQYKISQVSRKPEDINKQ